MTTSHSKRHISISASDEIQHKRQLTNTSSKTRRRLLISLGLLGLAGALFQPGYKLLEVRKGARTWAEKWHRPPKVPIEPGKLPTIENVSRMPSRIENDLTLKKADSPWIVDNEVMIPSGVTLTIEAGSEIFIGRKHYISVEGRILAEGTAVNPVRLRAYSRVDADKWAGLLIINTRTPSLFRHVEFENSYYGARLVHAAGTWASCSFMNVREVCSSFKSETLFKNCLIDYKDYPGHGNINVFKFHKASVYMEGCTIHCPHSDYKIDAIDGDFLEKGIFRGNRLYGGISPNTDAIDIGDGSRNILIESNVIIDFVDKGISVGGGGEAVINNNIIARCAIGVGLTNSAHAKVTHTTFYGNDYAVKCYERDPGQGGGHAEIEHCIIAGSLEAPFETDEKSTIRFTNTLCDQKLLPGKGNLQGITEFEGIGKDRFNCTGIALVDGDVASCHLSGTALGANISPYASKPPKRAHE